MPRITMALMAVLLILCPLLVDARPQAPPKPSGQAQGRLVLRPICFVDAAQRAAVKARRADLEAHEFKVAPDGAWIAYPAVPAAGYHVTCGSQTGFVRADGSFPISGSSGVFSHPTDAAFRAPFKIGRSRTYVWPVGFSMKGSPMGAGGCCPSVAQDGREEVGGRRVAAGGRFHGAAVPTAVRMGPRGSYPEPEFPLGCLDDDGGFNSGERLLDYVGSTCDAYVRAGVCINEWPATDTEYNTLRAVAKAAGFLDEGEFLSPSVVPQRKNACADNHKGRACQQLMIGDVSVDTAGNVTRAGGSTTVTVEAGKPYPFTVHNNGSTGSTEVTKTRDELGGTLSGKRPVLHYDVKGESDYKYQPDRELTYTAPSGKEGTDTFLFQTDGRFLEVSFKTKPKPTPTPAPAHDGQVTFRLHALLVVKTQAHYEKTSEQDEITYEQDETVTYRVVGVQPAWVQLKEISNTCTRKVSGGGSETGPYPRSWSYTPYGLTTHADSTLDLRGDGRGSVKPAVSWMCGSREASDKRGGRAKDVAWETITEYNHIRQRLPFTWTPGKASMVRDKDTHEKSYSRPDWNGKGKLTIEYTVEIGKIKQK